jgi:hypothetical protein
MINTNIALPVHPAQPSRVRGLREQCRLFYRTLATPPTTYHVRAIIFYQCVAKPAISFLFCMIVWRSFFTLELDAVHRQAMFLHSPI